MASLAEPTLRVSQPASIAACASTHPRTLGFVSATDRAQFFNRSGHAQRRTPNSARLVHEQPEPRSSLRTEWSSRSASATLSTAFGPSSHSRKNARSCGKPYMSTAASPGRLPFSRAATAWSGARAPSCNSERGRLSVGRRSSGLLFFGRPHLYSRRFLVCPHFAEQHLTLSRAQQSPFLAPRPRAKTPPRRGGAAGGRT